MKRQLNVKANLDAAVCHLLQDLSVKFNTRTVQANLQEHPDYPSLLAARDCFTDMGVDSLTVKIKKEGFDSSGFSFPFIAQVGPQNGKLVTVHDIKAGEVIFSDEKRHWRNISEETFLNSWNGIALFAEADENSIEQNFLKNKLRYLFNDAIIPGVLLLILIVFFTVLINRPFSWSYSLLCVFKFLGLCVTTVLLIQSTSASNPFIRNLCSFGGKNTCNAILKSESAKVTSWLSWSEVGFFYFAGTLIALLVNPSIKPFILWLNLFALPYTVYSIGHQLRIASWCALCCAVQIILWMEFFSNIGSGISSYYIGFSSPGELSGFHFAFLAFAIPVLGWFFLRPFFLDAAKLKSLQQELRKFKYNNELFNQALKNQTHYTVGEELSPIVIGNPSAKTVITMVSNPFCGPCGQAHQVIDEWLKTRDDLQLKVVFTTANEDDDRRTKVARHVSALSNLADKRIAENALHDWYLQSNKKYETWAEKYPVLFDRGVNNITENQKEWCKMAEITYTPTIFINGYKLPDPYRLEDIKYMVF